MDNIVEKSVLLGLEYALEVVEISDSKTDAIKMLKKVIADKEKKMEKK